MPVVEYKRDQIGADMFVFDAINPLATSLWYLKQTFPVPTIVRKEIMTFDWGLLPNFLYPKTVIKFGWQNWPKNQHLPYLWHFCGSYLPDVASLKRGHWLTETLEKELNNLHSLEIVSSKLIWRRDFLQVFLVFRNEKEQVKCLMQNDKGII